MKKNILFILTCLSVSSTMSPLFIAGTTVKAQPEVAINSECLVCNHKALYLFSLQRWFTFYFIPAFPPRDKIYYIGCLNCEQCYKLKKFINFQSLLDESFKGPLREIIKISRDPAIPPD